MATVLRMAHRGMLSSLLFDVAMDHFRGVSALFERLLYRLSHRDGAMLPSRAAKGNRQVAFSLTDVVGNQIGEQAFDAAQKFSGLGKRANVAAHFRVFSRVAAEARDEMRIRQETNIKNQVGVGGNTVAVAKTHDGDEHGPLVGIFEPLGNEVAQFVDVELRGINDHVCELADRFPELTLVPQTLADGKILSQRMGPARLAIAAQQRE